MTQLYAPSAWPIRCTAFSVTHLQLLSTYRLISRWFCLFQNKILDNRNSAKHNCCGGCSAQPRSSTHPPGQPAKLPRYFLLPKIQKYNPGPGFKPAAQGVEQHCWGTLVQLYWENCCLNWNRERELKPCKIRTKRSKCNCWADEN